MSYWEIVPFDILTSILPYLDFDDPKIIEKLSGDEYLKRRLQIEDPNGHIWKYIYTQKLSRDIPIGSDLISAYNFYITIKRYFYYDTLYYSTEKGYEILFEKSLKQSKPNKHQVAQAFIGASRRGNLNILKILVSYGAPVDSCNYYDACAAAYENRHRGVFEYVRSLQH